MSSAPGIACHAVTMTIASHAQSGLARMLSWSHAMPEMVPNDGSEFENRNLKTNEMMMAEMTIGITKIVRNGVLSRIRDVNATARSRAMMLTATTVTRENPKVKR